MPAPSRSSVSRVLVLVGPVLAALAAPLAADPLRFEGLAARAVGDQAYGVISADLNGDGAADLVTANSLTFDLSILLGDGRGGFASERRVPLGSPQLELLAVDLDGDGDLDLCAADMGRLLNVLLGDGAGGFTSVGARVIGSSASQLRVADLDGDGLPDLVIGFFRNAFYYPGDGAGRFGASVPIGVPQSHTYFVAEVGDFDEDGLPDVVSVGEGGAGGVRSIDAFFSRGTASRFLDVAVPSPLARPADFGVDALSADFDADGHLDLAATVASDSTVVVSLGNGRGRFSPGVRFPGALRPSRQSVADLDADGALDLVTAQYYPDAGGVVLRGDGAGAFSPPELVPTSRSPIAVVAADFDTDRHPDLAFALYVDSDLDDVAVFLNRSPELCAAGTVNAGAGALANVLFVNDSAGGIGRRVRTRTTDPFSIFVGAPPLATGPMTFSLYAWADVPPLGAAGSLPFGIGGACWPMPLGGGSPQPGAIWNNTGKAALGVPTSPSTPAPSIVLSRPRGLGRAATFSLQGIIADPGSAGARPASVTNAVIVEVR